MEVPDSSTFFAAVTGRALCTTEEYYSLVCNPCVPAVLLQVTSANPQTHQPPESKQLKLHSVTGQQLQNVESSGPTQFAKDTPAAHVLPDTTASNDPQHRAVSSPQAQVALGEPTAAGTGQTGEVCSFQTQMLLEHQQHV